VEIVFIVRINDAAKTVEVLRGQEGTTALAWNEGTKLECRITAGMLNVARARSAFPRTRAHSASISATTCACIAMRLDRLKAKA
jgi:hypothetical protein